MSLRPILRWPDPRLSRVCAPVGEIGDEVRALAADMLETMYAAPGRGLAASQVGDLRRLFVMDATWKDGAPTPMVFVDPRITWHSPETVTSGEGCLSIPGVLAEVPRALEIRAEWRDLDGTLRRAHFAGFAAICVQHEADHLDGIVTFDRLEAQARAALEADYLARPA